MVTDSGSQRPSTFPVYNGFCTMPIRARTTPKSASAVTIRATGSTASARVRPSSSSANDTYNASADAVDFGSRDNECRLTRPAP